MICLQCASVHVFAILVLRGYIGKMFLNYLKKIYTVSNEFSVYGSMLYIFIKKTINMCFMDRHFFFYCIR